MSVADATKKQTELDNPQVVKRDRRRDYHPAPETYGLTWRSLMISSE